MKKVEKNIHSEFIEIEPDGLNHKFNIHYSVGSVRLGEIGDEVDVMVKMKVMVEVKITVEVRDTVKETEGEDESEGKGEGEGIDKIKDKSQMYSLTELKGVHHQVI